MNSLAPGRQAANQGSRPARFGTNAVVSVIWVFAGPQRSRWSSLSGRFFPLICALSWCVAAAGAAGQSPPSTGSEPAKGDVLAQVIANQKRTDQALDVFERLQRMEIRKTANDPKPSEVKVWRIFPAGTGLDKIPLSPDAKPINEQSYRADLEKLEKQLIWAAQQGPGQREAYAKLERRQKERNDLIDATHDAFIFAPAGEEVWGDHKVLKYDMTPNPKYRPTTRNGTIFTKVRGSVWIDPQSNQLVRLEGRVTEDISLALFLARVNKGSYFLQERREVATGIWLPSYEQYDFDGRKYWFPISIHERTSYSNYRRVGPPKEALEVVRSELDKLAADKGDP